MGPSRSFFLLLLAAVPVHFEEPVQCSEAYLIQVFCTEGGQHEYPLQKCFQAACNLTMDFKVLCNGTEVPDKYVGQHPVEEVIRERNAVSEKIKMFTEYGFALLLLVIGICCVISLVLIAVVFRDKIRTRNAENEVALIRSYVLPGPALDLTDPAMTCIGSPMQSRCSWSSVEHLNMDVGTANRMQVGRCQKWPSRI